MFKKSRVCQEPPIIDRWCMTMHRWFLSMLRNFQRKFPTFLLSFVILLLGISYVSASSFFTVSSSPTKNKIMINEEARFALTIENKQGFDDDFRIYYSDVEWDFATDPRTESTVHIPDGQERTVDIVLKPTHVGYGSYGVTINIKSVKSEKLVRHNVLVYIISLGMWSPGKPIAVRTDINMPEEIDPRLPLNIKLNLENQYAINVSDLEISASSSFFSANKVVSLKPLEKQSFEFNINLDPKEPARKDIITIRLTSENQTFKEVEKAVEIIGYSSLRMEETKHKKGFLKTDREIVIFNDGNTKSDELFKLETPAFSMFYFFSKPKAKVISENGKTYLAWRIQLEQGDNLTISASKNFRPLILVSILIIVTIIGYFVFRSPIVIKKETKHVHREEGGVSKIKIMLHIKNRTRSKIKNIKIFERIPDIADIIQTFKIGTIHPTKVLKHERKGTIVKWVLEEIEGYEERMIIYEIKARLTILGSFTLPPAIIKFQDRKGKERVTSSNILNVKC